MTDHANRQKLIGNKPPMPKSIKGFLIAVSLVFMFLLVSEQDYQEAVAAERAACVYRGI